MGNTLKPEHPIRVRVDVPGNRSFAAMIPWGSDDELPPAGLAVAVQQALEAATRLVAHADPESDEPIFVLTC